MQMPIEDRRGLKALSLEKHMLKNPTSEGVILTCDGFLLPGVARVPDASPKPKPVHQDPYLGHKHLWGMSVEKL